MRSLPTVAIDLGSGRPHRINARDFDPAKHRRWGADDAEPAGEGSGGGSTTPEGTSAVTDENTPSIPSESALRRMKLGELADLAERSGIPEPAGTGPNGRITRDDWVTQIMEHTEEV